MSVEHFCEYCGAPLEQHYSVASAAKLLDCSEQFFRNLIRDRRIRYNKVERLVRIPESAIYEITEEIQLLKDGD